MMKGKRVTLRPVAEEDLQRYAEFRNDLEVQSLGGYHVNPVTLAYLRANYHHEADKIDYDAPWFAIEVDSKFVGQCSLRNVDHVARTWELGIAIGDRRYWGKGYGREAITLLLEFAFRYRNMHRVWLTTSAGNERALRAYRACGFAEEGRQRQHVWVDGRYQDLVYMGILREEWRAPAD
jgi:RimJ/RimL family protein N-acetyltransferase